MNEPVMKNAAVTAFALFVLTQVAIFSRHFGWWDPSVDDLTVIADAVGSLFAVALVVQGWFVRQRVTPTAKVALTKDDAKLLEAASDPQSPRGMGLLRDQAQIARDRVPPTL